MKLFSIKAVKWQSALLLFSSFALSSCNNPVFDDEGDCDPHYYVQYIYDMNMEWTDSFNEWVQSVELLVFDSETGDLVARFHETDPSVLSQTGYRMPIDIKPGNYDFVAWCGLENNMEDLFTLESSISHRDHARVKLSRQYEEGIAFQDKQLNDVFHGKVNQTLPDQEGEHVVKIHLIKDTNNINLSMQHISGETLTTDMFTITMSESNGHLAHDNSLIDDEDIEFRPWHLRSGVVDITGTKAEDGTNLNYFMAEVSTSRLMANRDTRLNIIENATGNTVYSIPIVQWVNAFRSQQYKDINNNIHIITDDQEYLDRKSDYEVMLYLDNGEKGWTAAQIYINSWKVVSSQENLN